MTFRDNLSKRLRASVMMDAHNGDSRERAICGAQMMEAAIEIDQLKARIEYLKSLIPKEST